MAANYYDLLGVSQQASADEIKRAYRRRARELHPDANPDDASAAERFREVALAYEVLSDPDQRARYDRFGEAGVRQGAGGGADDMFGGGLGDIFEAFFGGNGPFGGGASGPFGGSRQPSGPPQGQDMEIIADLDFEQAVFGATITVALKVPQRCGDCEGSGAGSGTRPVTCSDCGGAGQVRRVRQSMLGQMVTAAACGRCSGTGEVVTTPCQACRGEGRVTADVDYQVEIPAGVDTGSTMRLTGRGAAGPRGGAPGDLYVHLRVGGHDRYRREEIDLVTEVPVSIAQAALGTRFMLPTLDGDEELAIPAGTQHGREFVYRGRGVPRLQGRGRGDLRVVVHVEIPTDLSDDEAELLRTFARGRGETVGDAEPGLFARIKSAFS
jgi:molecular chaperone DnaJ